MARFLAKLLAAVVLLFAWIPLGMAVLDAMLLFLFDFTVLSWTGNRAGFAVFWTLIASVPLTALASGMPEYLHEPKVYDETRTYSKRPLK